LPIRPAELRKDWPWVRPLLEIVIAKTGEQWIAEDVYAAVSNSRALMHVSDKPAGVMVSYPDKEAWSGDQVLHVWALWCVDGMEALQDEAYAILTDVAKRVGAKRVLMESPRAGWQRVGWQVKKYIYEREVL
jgi:hypothetical protein